MFRRMAGSIVYNRILPMEIPRASCTPRELEIPRFVILVGRLLPVVVCAISLQARQPTGVIARVRLLAKVAEVVDPGDESEFEIYVEDASNAFMASHNQRCGSRWCSDYSVWASRTLST